MPLSTLMAETKRAAQAALRRVPVPVWERVAPKDVIALCYHLVSDEDLPHQRLYAYKNRRQFERDVEWARGRAIGYEEVARLRRRPAAGPANRVLFTFDDGLAECFRVIRPILRARAVPAVFFVSVDFLDERSAFFETRMSLAITRLEALEPERVAAAAGQLGLDDPAVRARSDGCLARRRLANSRLGPLASAAHERFVTWLLGLEEDGASEIDRACEAVGLGADRPPAGSPFFMTSAQVRQLAADGFTIGSHGTTHLPMQRLDAAALERQIVASCGAIRELTGQARVPFAFPYSGAGIDRALLADIRRRHEEVDLFFDTQAFRRDAPFVVQRLAADPPPPGDGVSQLPALLSSAWARRSAWYRASPADRLGLSR